MQVNNSTGQPAQTPASVIRKATATAHLETEKSLVRYVKQVRSDKEYAALLTCMYGYFAPLEKQLEPLVKDLLPDYQLRRKAGNMMQDLHVLQQDLPVKTALELPVTEDTASALGCLYVMEGSTLGGTIITKVIKDNNPAIPSTAFSFFAGYGNENISMWQSFVARFNELLQDEVQLSKAVNAACDCFRLLGNWIAFYYEDARK